MQLTVIDLLTPERTIGADKLIFIREIILKNSRQLNSERV